jgi:beta-fructofuranosidase
MIRNLFVVLLFFVLTLHGFLLGRPMAWWSFDEGEGRSVKDRVSGEADEIRGNYWYAEGVSGSCLKLDGYTTHVVRSRGKAPRLGDDFTVEAWVAPQTYPWNWAGIVDQEKDHKEGFFFGVSANGNVGLGVAAMSDGQWVMCVSKEKIELLKWSYCSDV